MTRPKLTGRQIMDWRQGIGKPRRWLAEQLGVSAKTIESWEYETRTPGGPALRLLELLMSNPPAEAQEDPKDDED